MDDQETPMNSNLIKVYILVKKCYREYQKAIVLLTDGPSQEISEAPEKEEKSSRPEESKDASNVPEERKGLEESKEPEKSKGDEESKGPQRKQV